MMTLAPSLTVSAAAAPLHPCPRIARLRTKQTRYMIERGNLPAAAQLMDHFNLHHLLPPLDPAEVEACARANAASHLQIPLPDSRVFVVDDWESLLYAERALAMPREVLGRPGANGSPAPGARCVGLDVESNPRDSKANVLQVRQPPIPPRPGGCELWRERPSSPEPREVLLRRLFCPSLERPQGRTIPSVP